MILNLHHFTYKILSNSVVYYLYQLPVLKYFIYLKVAFFQHYLGKSITGAVITVPAYFNHRQRAETMKAAELAGLNVLR